MPTYYDKGNAVASLGHCSRWSNIFAAAIHDICRRDRKCSTSVRARTTSRCGFWRSDPTLHIHAVDRSAHMIAEGQRRAGERKLTIHAQVCDAHVLPFPDNSFDAVTLQFASRHLEIIRAFKEIHRVLKPGGIFCHNDMLRPASRIVEIPYLVYLRFSVWFTAKIFGSSAESMKCVGYFANAIHHFYTPGELATCSKVSALPISKAVIFSPARLPTILAQAGGVEREIAWPPPMLRKIRWMARSAGRAGLKLPRQTAFAGPAARP